MSEVAARLTTRLKFAATFTWLLRVLYAYVPRRSASISVPQGGVESYEDVIGMRHRLINYWGGITAALSGPLLVASILAFLTDNEQMPVPRKIAFLATFLIFIVFAIRMGKALRDVGANTVFTAAAVRLIVARKGAHASPAAWVLDPRMWKHVYGPIVERLSAAEQDVIVALAEEWNGTAGELLKAAPILTGLPEKHRFSFVYN